MKIKYTRLYTDETGESHFEDIESELAAIDLVPSSPPLFLSSSTPAEHTAFFGAPANWTSDWHPSQNRNLFMVISGEWEIESSDGEVRMFGPNQVLLVEDTSGKGHRSKVLGNDDSLSLLVQLEEE